MLKSQYYEIPNDVSLPESIVDKNVVLHDLRLLNPKKNNQVFSIEMTLIVDDTFYFFSEISTDQKLFENWFGMFQIKQQTIRDVFELFKNKINETII